MSKYLLPDNMLLPMDVHIAGRTFPKGMALGAFALDVQALPKPDVEDVARVICAAFIKQRGYCPELWEDVSVEDKDTYRTQARAVLAALGYTV